MIFPTDAISIEKRIDDINPKMYGTTRNYLSGHVTHMSPYITHGYISLPSLRNRVLATYSKEDSYTFIFELAWREFFQRTWVTHGDAIFRSLRHEQEDVQYASGLPCAYLTHSTNIQTIDQALIDLTEYGYVHNHARMWMAMLVTNIAKTAWLDGSRHMYYHLLDGDRASNSLSWQWICGTFSSKKYIANQEMINRYALIKEHGTYLDEPVELLPKKDTPLLLIEHDRITLHLSDTLLKEKTIPVHKILKIETWLYSMWTLSPTWTPTDDNDVQKILFVDSDDLTLFPMSEKRIAFFLELSKNIHNLQLFYGTLNELHDALSGVSIHKKSHPALTMWPGKETSPEYLFPLVTTVPGGFMSFWKKCEAYL